MIHNLPTTLPIGKTDDIQSGQNSGIIVGGIGGSLQIEIALANNRMAKVIYPRDISEDDANKIGNVLSVIAG